MSFDNEMVSNMSVSVRGLKIFGVVGIAALSLAGCAFGGGGAATGTPITVAAITDSTTSPEVAAAVTGYFNRYNATGGYKGHPLVLTVAEAADNNDDAAASAASDVIGNSSVVALVGSSTAGECAVNSDAYEKADLVSFSALGQDVFCFTTPNIAPSNTGPFLDLYAGGWNALFDGAKKPCAIAIYAQPSSEDAFHQSIDNLQKITGTAFASVQVIAQKDDGNYAPEVVSALTHSCDAMLLSADSATTVSMISALIEQGASIPVYASSAIYNDAFIQAAPVSAYKGLISTPLQFIPVDDAANADLDALIAKGFITPASGWVYSNMQAGYLAAQNFIRALDKVDGDVTRDSLAQAARSDRAWPNEDKMLGNLWAFGPGKTHQANTSTFRVDIEPGSGSWTHMGPWLLATEMKWTDTVR